MALFRFLVATCALLVITAEFHPGYAASQSFCTDDPRYPEPEDEGLVFYLQRTGNANTVVYTVNQLEDGTIDPKDPVNIFWRHFASDGGTRELRFFERNFAFGVAHTPVKGHPGKYVANLRAYPAAKVLVGPTDDGQVRAVMPIAGQKAQLVCVYVEWRKRRIGIIPKVLYVDFFGRELDSGKKVVERHRP